MRTRITLAGAVALALAATAPLLAGGASAASAPTVVGYGHQDVSPAKSDLFGVFASGVGNAATGSMTFYANKSGSTKLVQYTATVTCLQVVGNRSIVSGWIKTGTTQTIVVGDMIDNSDPSGAPAADQLRFSFPPFVQPTGTL